MGNMIHAGLLCGLLLVRVRFCLSQGDGEVSDSFLQDLMRKLQEQGEKIAAIEANSKLDHSDLVSKVMMLEEKLKDSDYKQKKLEKTIENVDKVIKELIIKTWIKNKNKMKDERYSEKREQENSNLEPAVLNVVQNIADSDQDRSVAMESKQKRIVNERSHPSQVVAFYAYLGTTEGFPGLHHTIIFDTVITNVGSSYNQHDGVFTAPVNGVYVFNWNIYSGFNWEIQSELMVNSDTKGSIRSDSSSGGEDHSSTGFVVVEISQGDIIFIRSRKEPIDISTGPIPGRLYESSFSGWLL